MDHIAVLIVVVAAGTLAARAIAVRTFTPETFQPLRCALCGTRARRDLRMVAGRKAYVCEVCLRRGLELLESPEDITRFI